MPSEVLVELTGGVEEGVVFMGVAFRGLPVGRSRWRLPQSRDRALQGSTHYGYCAHGSHLLPMDHDHGNDRTPATRCAIGIKPVAVSLSNARFPCRKYKKPQVRDEESALKQLAGHDHALDLVGVLVDLGVVGRAWSPAARMLTIMLPAWQEAYDR